MAASPSAAPGGETMAFIAVEPTPAKQPAERIRKELFAAKTMAAIALGFAMFSVVLLAVALPRLGNLSGPASLHGVVGLDAVGMQEQTSGWHRTYLKTVVRKGPELDSEQVAVLPVGALVFVAEAHGRRARIMKPAEGWMSLRTGEGVEILRPDMTYSDTVNSTDSDKAFQSRMMQERNLRLQATSAKMTEMQRQLLDSMHKLKTKSKALERTSHKVGAEVGKKVPKVGQGITHSASRVLDKAMKPHGADNLLRQLTKDKDLQHLFKER